MINKKNFLLSILVLAMLLTVTSCMQTSTQTPKSADSGAKAKTGQAKGNKPVELMVSAAASLTDVMGDIAKIYNVKNSDVKITFNFGSSGAIQKQIEQGAPVDIFFSAAAKQMTELEKGGFILGGTKVDLFENKVVLIIPAGKNVPSSFEALDSPSVAKLALGEPNSVPVGQYSKEILTYYKIFDGLSAAQKLVYANDVREVLSWVETGNVDAGIVYETDAIKSKKIKIIGYAPENSHKTVIYPAAVVKNSKNPDSAKDFVNYLSTPECMVVFKSYGFTSHVK